MGFRHIRCCHAHAHSKSHGISWFHGMIALPFLLVFFFSAARGMAGNGSPDTVTAVREFKLAVARNDCDAVSHCLDSGLSPNAVWEYNSSPLIIAASNGNYAVAKLLIEKGAVNFDQRESWREMGETALIKAAKKGHTAVAILLSGKSDAGLATKYGWTALMFASQNGDAPLVDALLDRSVPVDATNVEGWTALMLAVDRGHRAICERLLAKGANAGHTSRDGFSPLGLATYHDYEDLAGLLRRHGTSLENPPASYATPPSGAGSNHLFSYDISRDSAGRAVVKLCKRRDIGDDGDDISLSIMPSIGNRITSLKIGPTELLALEDRPGAIYNSGGIPILFPTPNVVTDGTFVFEGTTVVMKHPAASSPLSIHGFAMDDSWRFATPELSAERVVHRAWYEMSRNNPRFSAFPYEHRISVAYELRKDRINISYEVRNTGAKRLGFGFGLHPYWRILGGRDKVRLGIDVPTILKGMQGNEVVPVANDHDLRTPRPLSQVSPGEMYFRLLPSSNVKIFFDALGLALTQKSSVDFTHLVTWIPAGKDYFAVEPQTCSANVHNCDQAGLSETSHLIIIEPGGRATGHVEYEFHADRPAPPRSR